MTSSITRFHYQFRKPLPGRQRSHREDFQHQHGRVEQIRLEQTFVDVYGNHRVRVISSSKPTDEKKKKSRTEQECNESYAKNRERLTSRRGNE